MAERTRMIGIAGSSCSGKTELASRLASRLPGNDSLIFSLDDYYCDLSHLAPKERERLNFDHPDALEFSLLHLHLRALAAGREIGKPVYCFETHTRLVETKQVSPPEFIIVEGLYALYWSGIRRLLDAKVFIEAEDAVCFSRRVERDVRERGRTHSYVIAQYARHTRPMFMRHVLPTKRYADVVVQSRNWKDAEEGVTRILRHLGMANGGS